jgi:hypothetical protein
MTTFKEGDIVQYQHVQGGVPRYNGWVGVVLYTTAHDVHVRWVVCGPLKSTDSNCGVLGVWTANNCNLVLLGNMHEEVPDGD